MCCLSSGVLRASSLYAMKHGMLSTSCMWFSLSFSVLDSVLLVLHSISMMLYRCGVCIVGLNARKSGKPVVPLLNGLDLACIILGGVVSRSIWLFHRLTVYPCCSRWCLVAHSNISPFLLDLLPISCLGVIGFFGLGGAYWFMMMYGVSLLYKYLL